MTPKTLTFTPETPMETSDAYLALWAKIETRSARVAVLGLGYVGLPLACAFASNGNPTTGFEVDPDKVAHIENGTSYIDDIPTARIAALADSGKLMATTDWSRLQDQDVIIICVPTPLRKTKDPDVSYIVAAVEQIKKYFRRGQLVVLESTTYPGTTRELMLSVFSTPEMQVGRDFFLAFSPERIDPGNKAYTIVNTPKVVGGVTAHCRELTRKVYAQVVDKVFEVSSVEAAEMTKLMENTFRAVNIALANEMALMCDVLGINVWEVIEAAKTKPFGFMAFYPGPGIGGHCIPLDPHYLAWKVRAMNFDPRFIVLAEAINSKMPNFVVDKCMDILNDKAKKSLSASTVLVLGVAYKKDVPDMRESPAIEVIEGLLRRKATVVYHDPHVPLLQVGEHMFHSQALDAKLLETTDLALIITDHKAVDYDLVLEKAGIVFDTRNVLKSYERPNVYSL